MKHCCILISTVITLALPQRSQADEAYYPEAIMLFASDLAVEASFVKNDGDYFWIKVRTVYNQQSTEVKPHDLLRVKQHTERYATQYFDFSAYDRARFYLQFESDTWSLEGGTSQAVKRTLKDSVWFDFYRSRIKLQADHFNVMYQEFARVYTLSPETGIPMSTLSASDLEAYKDHNTFIRAYESEFTQRRGDTPTRQNIPVPSMY